MKAMTLLRAMSAIDPSDIEAAYRAAGLHGTFPAPSPALTSEGTEPAGFPMPYPKPISAGKRYAIGGWAAAAACIALVAAAGLYFRSNDDYLTTHSGSEWITEITGTSPAETVPAQGTDDASAGSAETGTAPAVTVTSIITAPPEAQTNGTGTESPDMSSVPAATDHGIPLTTVTEKTTASTVTSAITTAAAPSEAAVPYSVPALLATADGSGTLPGYSPDTSYFPGEVNDFEVIDDADAIRAFLERHDPPAVLGTGRMSDADRDAILADPVLVHVRWQTEDDRWTTYGIQSAELDASGCLSFSVVMYSNSAPEHAEPWVYEIALLCRKSAVPEIRAASVELHCFADNDETGIENYMKYLESLSDDMTVRVTG
ncbi:MAG: hypothetical protein IKH27_14960 [Oscillospiraceae bacterium]|nr:hypothetical protein [Oscillospiraceae bacterium]